MTDVSRTLARDDRWIVEELIVEQDLCSGLIARLISRRPLAKLFSEARIDLSLFELGLRLEGTQPIASMEVALEQMLCTLKQQHKRLLVTIDEVVNNEHMRTFASLYQILVRKDLPIFLLMTGLFENVDSLQNEKSLTFLYRAPKVWLEPLGIRSIALNYERTFHIEHRDALNMAHLTEGYSFAFQLLGSIVWEHHGLTDEALDVYRAQLFELSYDKIWNELSPKDRYVVYGIVSASSAAVTDVRTFLNMASNEFSPYRRRLMNKGIVDGSQRGRVSFTLPLFSEYAIERYGETEL